MKKFEGNNLTVPEGFSGTSDELAKAMGITHRRLGLLWRKSEAELRAMGVISVSK